MHPQPLQTLGFWLAATSSKITYLCDMRQYLTALHAVLSTAQLADVDELGISIESDVTRWICILPTRQGGVLLL